MTADNHVDFPQHHLQSTAAFVDESDVMVDVLQPSNTGRSERPSQADVRTLAHQLNSLLDGSIRTLETVRRKIRNDELSTSANTPDEVDQRLTVVLDTLRQMGTAVGRALEQESDSTQDHIEHSFDRTSLTERIDAIITLLEPLAESKRVKFSLVVDPTLNAVATGPLAPAIVNIIENAIEAASETQNDITAIPSVEIVAEKRGGQFVLTVVDTGPGIDPNLQPGATTRSNGHGIGLVQTQDIVANLGGRLSLRNIPFAPGAIAELHIPLAALLVA